MLDAADKELFRDNVRRFLNEEVAPHYDDWERDGIVPKAALRRFGEMGLLCVDMPERYGGGGGTFELSMIVGEECARIGFMALSSSLTVHSDIVAPYILNLGSEAQKSLWLPRMASGEIIGAIAMTEPGAGSDLQGIRTSALPDAAGGYRLSGSKTFITNGQNAGVVIVVAKTDPEAGARGTTLFLVDTDRPGFSRGRNLDKIGLHSGDTSELFLSEVVVAEEDILGVKGGGFGHLIDELPRERLALAAGAVAHAEGALALTVDYVRERQAFGTPLASFQNTRFELARARADIMVNKAFVQQCIALYADSKLDVPTAAMAKYSATEMEGRVCDTCLQLFGGYGYMEEYPISRYFVDARVQRIYGGTSEIMLEVLARDLLGR